MSRYKPKGWRGESHKHALAAKGIKIYNAAKADVRGAIFYSRMEKQIPSKHLRQMVKEGLTFNEMQRMHPDADKEELRLRGIRTIDGMNANSTLSTINKNGVDEVVRKARNSSTFKKNLQSTMKDSQASSFIQDVKIKSIGEKL